MVTPDLDDGTTRQPVKIWRQKTSGARRPTAAHLAAMLLLLLPAACGAAPAPAAWGVITIGGATYRLPAVVFDGGEALQGRQDSMLLQLPLMARRQGTDGEVVTVLMLQPNPSKTRTPNELNSRSIWEGVHAVVSLDPCNRNHKLIKIAKTVTDDPPGLMQVATESSNSLGDDVFVLPPLSRPVEYIYCSRFGGMNGLIRNPQCQQEFVGLGVRIKLTYSRLALSKWQEIEQGVLNYLKTHKVS